MARYRFQWENLPPDLLQAILAATGSADVQTLRRTWGARPKENLVEIHRELLAEQWLAHDGAARRAVVDGLRERKLGNNAKSFQAVVLKELVRLGEAPAGQSRGWRLIGSTTDPLPFDRYPHQSEAWAKLAPSDRYG